MKVLIVGAEGKGSWAMRGRQLGAAIGARVTTMPMTDDWRWADVVVLVKRAIYRHAAAARATGTPVLWDALDFWQQPEDNGRTEADLRFEAQRLAHAAGASIIGATQAMAADLGGVYLSHHCRLALKPAPPRPHVTTVGYDGCSKYLGPWTAVLEKACTRRGWSFVINPPDLRNVDILVAFRGDRWDGWACRQWKSGVKYVNAIVAGRPVVTQPTAAFSELRPVGRAIDDPHELDEALDDASALSVRQQAYALACVRARAFTVDVIGRKYAEMLHAAARNAA